MTKNRLTMQDILDLVSTDPNGHFYTCNKCGHTSGAHYRQLTTYGTCDACRTLKTYCPEFLHRTRRLPSTLTKPRI